MIPNKPLNEFTQEELIEKKEALQRLISGTRELLDAIKEADDEVIGLMNLSFEFSDKGVSLIDFISLAFDNLNDFMRTKAVIEYELKEREAFQSLID